MSDFTAVNESYEEAMDDEDEEEAEDTGSNYSDEEDEENQSANIPKNHPVEIHSYSVIKIKREPGTFKKTTSRAPATRDRKKQHGGRKYKVSNSISQKKQKLYEMEPLGDPIAEKNRLNALNAKKNRDRKKQLLEAEQEISRLREENEELRTEAEEVRDELESAQRELAELRALMKQSNGGRHSVPGKARAHNSISAS